MPIPFMAAGALATILGATQDCEHNLSDDEGYQRKALPPSTTGADAAEVATSPTNNSNAKQKETSVRSIVYESSVSRKNLNRSSTRHLLATEESFLRHHNKALPAHRVEVPLLASIDVDEDNNEIAGGGIPANHSTEHDDCSYLDASFRSGLTASMAVDEGCFAIAAAVTAADVSLWAVGTVGAVQVYLGTTLATTIVLPSSTSRGSRNFDKSAMVSALCWVDGNLPHTTKQSQRHTLVVTTLGGQMAVYRIDPELLEVEGGGVQPLLGGERFVWDVRSEVRSVAATVWDDLVLVILGDVTGELHLFSWPLPQWNNRQAKSLSHVTLPLASAAILQVAWHPSPDSRQFALATEGGAVDVYDLNSDLATTKLIWSIQRAGPVRALDWNAGFLALGGYDKTCVLVDTSVWGIARELVLDGTVRGDGC
jgi:WD40 repeat protein